MYSINIYDYKNDRNYVKSNGSLGNILEKVEELMHRYIVFQQGIKYSKNYDELVYSYNDSPDLSRKREKGSFYIRKSKNNPHKFIIVEKIKVYGWVINQFEYVNHYSFTITYKGKFKYKTFINTCFQYYDDFDHVLKLINELNKEEDN